MFHFDEAEGAAAKIIQFKVRRLLYEDIAEVTVFPNFKGARLLGFCLNVLGLGFPSDRRPRHETALRRAVLAWVKKHYAWLHANNAEVAEACLVYGFTYEANNLRIVKTYPVGGLRRTAKQFFWTVLPADPARLAAPDYD